MTNFDYCEHKYRRDVESCPYCELAGAEAQVARLQRERDEAQEVTRKTVASLIAVTTSVDRLEKERDAALALLAETWEWTTPAAYRMLGYRDLARRVAAALKAKEEPGSDMAPTGQHSSIDE